MLNPARRNQRFQGNWGANPLLPPWRRRGPGFIINDAEGAVSQQINPVCLGCKKKSSFGSIELKRSENFAPDLLDFRPVGLLPRNEPVGNPEKPGPPKGPGCRVKKHVLKR